MKAYIYEALERLFILLAGLALGIMFSMNFVTAWPYQLNLTSGELIDLNVTNNETSNFTIYVIWQNVSQVNITTIYQQNYTNVTCFNCTEYYNETYVYGNNSGYTKTEANSLFTTLTEYNAYKSSANLGSFATQTQFNNLSSRIDNIETPANTSSWLWIMSIFALLLAIIAIILAILGGFGGE